MCRPNFIGKAYQKVGNSLGAMLLIHAHVFYAPECVFLFIYVPDLTIYPHKGSNFTAIAKKLCSSLHGKIELKLFTGEALPKPNLLEKYVSC